MERGEFEVKKEEPQYTLAILEVPGNDGTRRYYMPVLKNKEHEFYEEAQCGFDSDLGDGRLSTVIERARERVEEDEKSGNYIHVWVETPDMVLPKWKEFVNPEQI